jgi:hypothetical protein
MQFTKKRKVNQRKELGSFPSTVPRGPASMGEMRMLTNRAFLCSGSGRFPCLYLVAYCSFFAIKFRWTSDDTFPLVVGILAPNFDMDGRSCRTHGL